MRIVSNEELDGKIEMGAVVDVLRRAYAELGQNQATYVPLVWLYAPTPRSDDYYRCSSVLGSSQEFNVVALRIKSDVVSWPGNSREAKYAREPGTYCGLIMLFSSVDAQPLAIIQDGIIQHMRVGAASAIGVDVMASPSARTVGILGSGGMARSHLEAIACVRELASVRVFSPTPANAQHYASEMSNEMQLDVVAVPTARDAVDGVDIVVSATSSLAPTFETSWLAPGAHITCVQLREVPEDIFDVVGTVAKLGEQSLPPESGVPGMERVKGGFSAYIAGSEDDKKRIPRGADIDTSGWASIGELITNTPSIDSRSSEPSLFLPIGTQGVQFASVGGFALQVAEEAGVGQNLPSEWFLESIRN